MKKINFQLLQVKSLRSYITIMITGIIALSLIISGGFFYIRTFKTLRNIYQEQIIQQLENTIGQITEQIDLLDSLYTHFISNNLIYDSLEQDLKTPENITAVEKQMTYLLITNYVWKEKFINAISIYASDGTLYRVSIQNSSVSNLLIDQIYETVDKKYPSLKIEASNSYPNTLYFIRNIFSSNSGQPIATMIIEIDSEIWINYLGRSLEDEWLIYLYNDNWQHFSTMQTIENINFNNYLSESEKIDKLDLHAVVLAPKNILQLKLNHSLKNYFIVMFLLIIVVLLIAYAMSKVITVPITNLIRHINRIAEGHYDENIPAMNLYAEFTTLGSSFNNMLNKINSYHKDNLEKQLLLKNAEIQALQAQINPHFLFNTLNTLAWKAEMSDNPDLYQMVISLGELLKTNIRSRSSSFIMLQEELRYIKFYIYLQKMRFEDKITVDFNIETGLDNIEVPCFCIQSLVENAFVHGLEPKKGTGKLVISIESDYSSENKSKYIYISVKDNGIGFAHIPDIPNITSSMEDSHTHIGLRNLDRRLFLIYGDAAHISISSIPDEETIVSFKIPLKESVHVISDSDC